MQFPAVAAAAVAVAAAAAEPYPARYFVRLAGEVDEDELLDENAIGPAGMTWLRETGLSTYPSPPPPASSSAASSAACSSSSPVGSSAHVAVAAAAAAAAGSSPARRVLRLSGDVDEADIVGAIGIAGLSWLRVGAGGQCSPRHRRRPPPRQPRNPSPTPPQSNTQPLSSFSPA